MVAPYATCSGYTGVPAPHGMLKITSDHKTAQIRVQGVVGGLEAPGEGTGADELHGIAPGGTPLGGVDDLVANGVPVAEADGDGLMDADDVERRVEEGGGLEVHVVVVVAGDAVSDKVDGLLGPLRDLRGGGLGTG